MKIEIGKTYINKAGERVRCYACDYITLGDARIEVHGSPVKMGGAETKTFCVTRVSDGCCYNVLPNGDSLTDSHKRIICEWTDEMEEQLRAHLQKYVWRGDEYCEVPFVAGMLHKVKLTKEEFEELRGDSLIGVTQETHELVDFEGVESFTVVAKSSNGEYIVEVSYEEGGIDVHIFSDEVIVEKPTLTEELTEDIKEIYTKSGGLLTHHSFAEQLIKKGWTK